MFRELQSSFSMSSRAKRLVVFKLHAMLLVTLVIMKVWDKISPTLSYVKKNIMQLSYKYVVSLILNSMVQWFIIVYIPSPFPLKFSIEKESVMVHFNT